MVSSCRRFPRGLCDCMWRCGWWGLGVAGGGEVWICIVAVVEGVVEGMVGEVEGIEWWVMVVSEIVLVVEDSHWYYF